MCLASASRDEGGYRFFLVVRRGSADFDWLLRWQCGFVPVFFGPEFLAASLQTSVMF